MQDSGLTYWGHRNLGFVSVVVLLDLWVSKSDPVIRLIQGAKRKRPANKLEDAEGCITIIRNQGH